MYFVASLAGRFEPSEHHAEYAILYLDHTAEFELRVLETSNVDTVRLILHTTILAQHQLVVRAIYR
jgi:hypothetical protein